MRDEVLAEEAIDWLMEDDDARWEAIPSAFESVNALDEAAIFEELEAILPETIHEIQSDPEAADAFEALTGIDINEASPTEAEVWPAIIGGIVSALPAIVKAAPGLIRSVRGLTGSRRPRRRPPRRRPPRPRPRRSSTVAGCPPVRIDSNELMGALNQLLPILTQMVRQR